MITIRDQFNNVVVADIPLCLFALKKSPMKNRLLEHQDSRRLRQSWRLRCARKYTTKINSFCTDNHVLEEEDGEWLRIPQ